MLEHPNDEKLTISSTVCAHLGLLPTIGYMKHKTASLRFPPLDLNLIPWDHTEKV